MHFQMCQIYWSSSIVLNMQINELPSASALAYDLPADFFK